MAILTIAVSITAPSLSNFFHGRSLDSEARRLLSLTRQGQSRATSEGFPMQLWVDSARNEYGLEADTSYEQKDAKATTFQMDKDIQIQAVNLNNVALAVTGASSEQDAGLGSSASLHSNLPKIRFQPDGSVSETSPEVLRLTGRDGVSLSVALSRSRLNYEIRSPSQQ